MICPRSFNPIPLNMSEESDVAVMHQLREVLGDFFAERLSMDSQQAMGVLSGQEG